MLLTRFSPLPVRKCSQNVTSGQLLRLQGSVGDKAVELDSFLNPFRFYCVELHRHNVTPLLEPDNQVLWSIFQPILPFGSMQNHWVGKFWGRGWRHIPTR